MPFAFTQVRDSGLQEKRTRDSVASVDTRHIVSRVSRTIRTRFLSCPQQTFSDSRKLSSPAYRIDMRLKITHHTHHSVHQQSEAVSTVNTSTVKPSIVYSFYRLLATLLSSSSEVLVRRPNYLPHLTRTGVCTSQEEIRDYEFVATTLGSNNT
jgi:hypothetical protein